MRLFGLIFFFVFLETLYGLSTQVLVAGWEDTLCDDEP